MCKILRKKLRFWSQIFLSTSIHLIKWRNIWQEAVKLYIKILHPFIVNAHKSNLTLNGIWGPSSRKKWALFHYFNQFCISSGVGSSKWKVWNKFYKSKKLKKTVKIFPLNFWRHRKILILHFSILAMFFTPFSKCAS